MIIPLTSDNIVLTLTAGGAAFAVYRSYRDPQAKSEQTDAVMNTEITYLKENVNKILSNHLPHIDAKLSDIHDDQARMQLELNTKLTRLETIISERLPKA